MLVAELEKRLIEVLKRHNADFTINEGQYGKTYYLARPHARLELTIDPSWIGCNLEIDKSVVGRKIGLSVDTDNYPISEENVEASSRVFEESMSYLDAFLEDEIYVGLANKKPALALPEDGLFRLTLFGRFSSETKKIRKQDIETLGLYRLSDSRV